MKAPLPIIPFINPIEGEVPLPGSKSITNRALVLAVLSKDRVNIRNALISDDTLTMVKALKALGFCVTVNTEEAIITVEGERGEIPKNGVKIDVGNAGTVARFLPVLLCLKSEGTYYLDGSPAMKNRPMRPLLDALESIGAATFIYHEKRGFFPFSMKTHGFFGGNISIDISKSSQFLSALLLLMPLSRAPLNISFGSKVVSWPFIEMSLTMMNEFGQEDCPVAENNAFKFPSYREYVRSSGNYIVEPDLTVASYFLALALITKGEITFPGLTKGPFKQGDYAFAQIMENLGLKIEKTSLNWQVNYVESAAPLGQNVNLNAISDTFLTLAAIAPLFKGSTTISGIAHTRHQETDRISAMATELKKLGQEVIEREDSLTIHPRPLRPGVINTYNDHRIAMSFAVLGCFNLFNNGKPWIFIDNPDCCTKTFPNFFHVLNALRK